MIGLVISLSLSHSCSLPRPPFSLLLPVVRAGAKVHPCLIYQPPSLHSPVQSLTAHTDTAPRPTPNSHLLSFLQQGSSINYLKPKLPLVLEIWKLGGDKMGLAGLGWGQEAVGFGCRKFLWHWSFWGKGRIYCGLLVCLITLGYKILRELHFCIVRQLLNVLGLQCCDTGLYSRVS